MLQRRFIDGHFDPALQHLLRLHARTDDFVTTVGKARQYMDAQEQAKISAMSKKPNVRFAASDELPPTVQMQPILDGLQKVLEVVLEKNPEVKVVKPPEPGGTKKGKGGNHQPTSTPSEASTNTSAPATGSRNPSPPPRGRGNNDPPRRARDDTQMLPQNSNRQGNRQNRSSSVDSQFRQPVQDNGPPPRARKGCYVCGQANCHSDLHLENPPPPGWCQSQGCRICGQQGCHSDNHQGDTSTPLPRAPPPPRELQKPPAPRQEQGRFVPWEGYSGCFRCGRMDCRASFHVSPGNPPPQVPFTSQANATSNWQRGSSKGDQTPPNAFRPPTN